MAILSFTSTLAGQVGNFIGGNVPRRVSIISSDGLSTITTAGYLNHIVKESGNNLYPTDIIDLWYDYVSSSDPGTYDVFTLLISGSGVITLVPEVSVGTVLLPVVSGNFSVFNGTSGQIADDGYLPSDNSKTRVVMANAATVLNHIMVSTDITGTSGNLAGTAINDGSIQAGRDAVAGNLISFPGTTANGRFIFSALNAGGAFDTTVRNSAMGQSSVISIPDPVNALGRFLVGASATPFISGNFPVASGTGGLMIDSGLAAADVQNSNNILSATTANIGGAGAGPISVIVAGLTAASIVTGTIESSSNAVQVQTITATATGFDVVFSGDPGASCLLNYVAFLVAQ